MEKYDKYIGLLVLIYSIIFFLIIPVVFGDWDGKTLIHPLTPLGWYLVGFLILCILVGVLGYFYHIHLKKQKKNPNIFVVALWFLLLFYTLYLLFSLPVKIFGGPTNYEALGYAVLELMFLVIITLVLYYFIKKDKEINSFSK